MASADSLKVDLHKNFAEWVNQEGLTSPTEDQWKEIMEEDCRSYEAVQMWKTAVDTCI